MIIFFSTDLYVYLPDLGEKQYVVQCVDRWSTENMDWYCMMNSCIS